MTLWLDLTKLKILKHFQTIKFADSQRDKSIFKNKTESSDSKIKLKAVA